MKLSFSAILECLQDTFAVLSNSESNMDSEFEGICLYDPEITDYKNMVSICKSDDIREITNIEECCIISTGQIPTKFIEKNKYIFLPTYISVSQVFNKVNTLMAQCSKWSSSLREVIIEEKGLQALLDVSLHMFNNPIYIHDKDYRIIAYSTPKGYDSTCQYTEGNKISLHHIRNISMDKSFQKSFELRSPTLHPADNYDNCYIFNNIFINNKFFGRIIVDEYSSKITSLDFALLTELTKIAETMLTRRNIYPNSHYRKFENLLIAIIDKKTVDMAELSVCLKEINWNQFSNFFCFQVKLSENETRTNFIIGLSELMEHRISSSYVFPYNGNIVGIASFNKNETIHSKCLLSLQPIAQEFNLSISVSSQFSDILDVKKYYIETCITLEQSESALSGVSFYKDYIFKYLLCCCITKLDTILLCPEGLKLLIEHDKANGTEYSKTLETYLYCGMSQAKAIKALFIHRSTFLYRLRRIEEITNINYEDSDELVHYMLAYKLLNSKFSKE